MIDSAQLLAKGFFIRIYDSIRFAALCPKEAIQSYIKEGDDLEQRPTNMKTELLLVSDFKYDKLPNENISSSIIGLLGSGPNVTPPPRIHHTGTTFTEVLSSWLVQIRWGNEVNSI